MRMEPSSPPGVSAKERLRQELESSSSALVDELDFFAQNEQIQGGVKLSIHAMNIIDQVTHRKTIAS